MLRVETIQGAFRSARPVIHRTHPEAARRITPAVIESHVGLIGVQSHQKGAARIGDIEKTDSGAKRKNQSTRGAKAY
jgi:hypothetical protein